MTIAGTVSDVLGDLTRKVPDGCNLAPNPHDESPEERDPKRLKAGDSKEPDTIIGPLITEQALAVVKQRVVEVVDKGAKVLAGGESVGRFQATLLALPFGGVEDSGSGRFGGSAVIDEFTELRRITVSGSHPFPL